MPRYFFDVHDGVDVRDAVGAVLPSLREARREAMQIARSYAGRPEMEDAESGAIVVDVRDEAGVVLITIRLVFSIEAA